MKKRGQFSAFFVVGILILVMIGITLYITAESEKEILEPVKQEAIGEGVLPPLKTYVKRCLLQASREPIKIIGLQGGTIDPADFIYYYGNRLNYLCLRDNPETACRNTLLTVQRMEYELEKVITAQLEACIELDAFRAEGASVEEGKLNVNVTIGSDSVIVQADYPINITENADQITKVKEFQHVEDVPLGRLYDLAQAITNDEIKKGDFSKDEWMIKHNAEVIIEKHKPYPDNTYILERDDYKFQFGIQGVPTVGMRSPEAVVMNGCCINKHDGTCFANVPEPLCTEIGGRYDPSTSCECPEAFSFDQGTELIACESTYDPETDDFTGPRRRHGESWCQYETITGKGYDYVGSRHYLHTCIDGAEIVEECRDYREEICVEEIDEDNLHHAECRANRWYDCADCNTEACCENTDFRDCYWNEWLEIEGGKCTPYVPPGLKFWERKGSDVCFQANREMTCEGLSCPNNFIDSSAILCYKQGDCGNYRNTEDIATTEGFFETDVIDSVRPYVMLPPRFNRNYGDWTLRLPLGKTEEKLLTTAEKETPAGNIPSMIQSGAKFIDDIMRIEFSDFAKPFKGEPVVEVTDYTLCDLWTSPVTEMRCEECGKHILWPCTEYKCKSLGEMCTFENKDGIPTCREVELDDDEPPVIDIDPEVIDERYTYEEDSLAGFEGYHLKPEVLPYKPLELGIITDEPTRCKIDYSPTFKFVEDRQGYYSLPSIWFGEPAFNTSHRIRFRTPPKIMIPQKILDFLNFSSTDEFSGAVEDLEGMYEGYKKDYKDTLELYEKFSGESLTKELNPMVESIWDAVTMIVPEIKTVTKMIIDQYTSGGYYIFVKCIDRAGNENEEQFYFKFEVDKNLEDNDPPQIETTRPEQAAEYREEADVRLYLDEPAECRYGLEDMPFTKMNRSFDCVTSAYQISPVDGGTYECRRKIRSNESELRLYIRCADKPLHAEKYLLRVKPEYKFALNYTKNITGYDPSSFAGIEGNTLKASADFLEMIELSVPGDSFGLDLYIDDYLECGYSMENMPYEEMQYNFTMPSVSSSLEKGQYKVSADIWIRPEEQNLSIGRYMLNITRSDESSVHNSTFNKTFSDVIYGHDTVEFNSTLLNVEFHAGIKAQCRYSPKDENYSSMDPLPCSIVDNATVCRKGVVVDYNKTLYIECKRISQEKRMPFDLVIKCSQGREREQNIMNASYTYILKKGVPLEITSLSPAGQVKEGTTDITARVNKNIDEYDIECGYTADLAAGFTKMTREDSKRFSIPVEVSGGRYTIFIRCEDKYGSRADDILKFEAVI